MGLDHDFQGNMASGTRPLVRGRPVLSFANRLSFTATREAIATPARTQDQHGQRLPATAGLVNREESKMPRDTCEPI
jgi:hypothetical protein